MAQQERWAWSSFQNAPTAATLPIPSSSMMSSETTQPSQENKASEHTVDIPLSTEPVEVDLRQEVTNKLRAAVMAGDIEKLKEAVSEAEAAGLTHEAAMGKKKLATLQ